MGTWVKKKEIQEFGPRFFDMSSASGYMGEKYFQEFGPRCFAMSSASGYMGAKYFQQFGLRFFDISSASGYMGEKYFQEFGPRFVACHIIFGVSCSKCCVSWRVNIYRVNEFRVVSSQNSACQRVSAMSWPP